MPSLAHRWRLHCKAVTLADGGCRVIGPQAWAGWEADAQRPKAATKSKMRKDEREGNK